MSSTWGTYLNISIFGESHGPAIGVVINGLPPGEAIDQDQLEAFMRRRAPGNSPTATARKEPDKPEILSGMLNGKTTGAPLAAIIRNTNQHSADYDNLYDVPRPGHADYTAELRYRGNQDLRGGGHFSGRLTAPLCIAGGIAIQILRRRNITVAAHLLSVATVQDDPFNPINPTPDYMLAPTRAEFPVLNQQAGQDMKDAIAEARRQGDSLGGRIEIMATGVPGGLGSPMFDGVENRLASILFGIPAVRGLEFGYGMGAAELKGSQHNDPFVVGEDGGIRTVTNHHGGILGGITSGMPIVVRMAIKPTPSILQSQQSISLSRHENVPLQVRGRHDPCIAPRAVPVAEAAMAVALLDLLTEAEGRN